MNSLELIKKVQDKELELGDFIYVYETHNGWKKIPELGFLRYNGVELLGLEQFEEDLLINPNYCFTINSQEDVLDILDNTEKRYLNNILKPYKQRIVYIAKKEFYNGVDEYEYITIKLRDTKRHPFAEQITLPFFRKGTMYKNMELDKEYTFKELIKW